MSNRFPDHNHEAMPADLQDIYARLLDDGAAFRAPPPATTRLDQLVDTLAVPLLTEEQPMQQETSTSARIPMTAQQPPRRKRWISGVSAFAAVVLLAVLSQMIFAGHHRTSPGANITASPSVKPYTLTQEMLHSVSMVSSTEGWAAGERVVSTGLTTMQSSALLYHYHDGAWAPVYVLPTTNTDYNNRPVIRAVAMVSATDGWAFGGYQTGSAQGFILHYDGTAWTPTTTRASSMFVDAQMLYATDGWAIAGGDNSLPYSIYHYDGHNWVSVPVPHIAGHATLLRLALSSATDGWIAGSTFTGNSAPPITGVLLHYQAGAWSLAGTFANVEPVAISMASTSDGWIAGWSSSSAPDQRLILFHDINGTWVQVASPVGDASMTPNALRFITPTNGWLGYTPTDVHQQGQLHLLHYDGHRWQVVQMPSLSKSALVSIESFSFTASGDAWATGSTFVTRPDVSYPPGFGPQVNVLLLHYQNGSWSIVQG